MAIGLARDIYRPTLSEEKKCAALMTALRIPAATYDRYQKQVRAFLSKFTHNGKTRRATPVSSCGVAKFEMHKSLLFGQEYLVAYADAAWMQRQAPNMDAVASPDTIFYGIRAPALVLIPGAKEKADDPAFLAVLEHEFVHVHQILLGTFPNFQLESADKWLREIFKITRAEYEANLIEFVRWPRLFSAARANLDITLEDYCALRGYTQGLEKIIHATAVGKLDESELLRFLERLPAALPSGFPRIGLDERLGNEYAAKLPDHVAVTLYVLTQATPGLKSSLYSPALGRWLKGGHV